MLKRQPLPKHLRARTTLAASCLLLAGCATDRLDLAPDSAITPWVPEGETATAGDFAVAPEPGIAAVSPEVDAFVSHVTAGLDPERDYSLGELIDLAQKINPMTRIAWENARQAALSVGQVEATFLPIISANVIAGAQEIVTPLPSLSGGTDYVDTTATGVMPILALQWLLFDFGQRQALLEAAEQGSYAANVSFNGAHQALIFNVARAYYMFGAMREDLEIARRARANSGNILAAARARLENGTGTTIEVAQARQQGAEAKLLVVQSEGLVRDAYQDLLGAVGLSPNTRIRVASSAGRALPAPAELPTDALIEAALARRPDVIASYAQMQASQQAITAAEADYWPKVFLGAAAATTNTSLGVGSLPRLGAQSTATGVLVGATLPIFDGGLRDAQVARARSLAAAAEAGFRQTRNAAMREIVVAADALRSALEAHQAAGELVSAAATAYDAAYDAYRNGLGSLTVATMAEDGLLAARRARSDAHAAAQVAAATLAFTLGQMTSGEAATAASGGAG